jgi:hypothetical protein
MHEAPLKRVFVNLTLKHPPQRELDDPWLAGGVHLTERRIDPIPLSVEARRGTEDAGQPGPEENSSRSETQVVALC